MSVPIPTSPGQLAWGLANDTARWLHGRLLTPVDQNVWPKGAPAPPPLPVPPSLPNPRTLLAGAGLPGIAAGAGIGFTDPLPAPGHRAPSPVDPRDAVATPGSAQRSLRDHPAFRVVFFALRFRALVASVLARASHRCPPHKSPSFCNRRTPSQMMSEGGCKSKEA